jgi:2-haloacid dehalogenase
MKQQPQLLIFDVNETLLDLSPLKQEINSLLESDSAFELWFGKLIQYAMVETMTGSYSDFGKIGVATLQMTAKSLSKSISEEKINSTLSIISQLKPHADVLDGLDNLKEKGYRLVALTNGGTSTLKKQMAFSGLEEKFDALYSVESVQKFKPYPDTYNYVLNREKCQPNQAMLIAAHSWDIIGAQNAGLQTAFIQREGKFLYINTSQPELICSNFKDLKDQLIIKHQDI